MEVLYPNKPSLEVHNWSTWCEHFDEEHKEFLVKLRNSYSDIEHLGIRVLEVVFDDYWVQQYPYEYVRQTYPELHTNKLPHVIFAYKLDGNQHLHIDPAECSMYHINNFQKKLFAEYIFMNFLGKFVYEDEHTLRLGVDIRKTHTQNS